jgi:Nucleotide-diphospho-sugar transferase
VPVMGTGGVGAARNGGPNVTVVAVNFAYRELAMNFVCRLGGLGIDQAYVILAMDRAMYTYASARGVNVFYHSVHASEMKESMEKGRNSDGSDVPAVDSDEDHGKGDDNDTGFKFGSRGFVRTSRRKSMLVAEVLALGYDVFFSDVDVILYSNPHAVFRDYAEDFVVMSDSHLFNRTQALNYNLNSGFYYVRARPRNYVALRAIVKYGEKSKRSEQKAFKHVLCGAFKDDTAGPGWRFGDNRCYYRIMGGVSTRVLSTSEFPNGSDASLFELPPSIVDAVSPGMVALHVNHVSGRDTKMSRIKGIGQWFYDTDGCQQVPAEEEMNPEPAEKDRQQAVSDFRRNRSRQYIFQSDMPLDENEVTRNIHRGERHDWAQPEANLEALLQHEARVEAQKQKQRLEQDQEVHEVGQRQEEGQQPDQN